LYEKESIMNMVLKKQMANRRGRTGFTLVEVIVVLVILAILAAIAIPALTGYIEKAEFHGIEQHIRNQRMAVQTMLNEFYAEHGGFDGHQTEFSAEFGAINEPNYLDSGEPYFICHLKENKFYDEYEKLTGDTQSFRGHNRYQQTAYVWFDASGAIVSYTYIDYTYFVSSGFPRLYVYYFKDINSPYAKKLLVDNWVQFPDIQTAKDFGFKSGYTLLRQLQEGSGIGYKCFELIK
jgi:prepilin-type N-terminal cleavage/methylation domain-containing protein